MFPCYTFNWVNENQEEKNKVFPCSSLFKIELSVHDYNHGTPVQFGALLTTWNDLYKTMYRYKLQTGLQAWKIVAGP